MLCSCASFVFVLLFVSFPFVLLFSDHFTFVSLVSVDGDGNSGTTVAFDSFSTVNSPDTTERKTGQREKKQRGWGGTAACFIVVCR